MDQEFPKEFPEPVCVYLAGPSGSGKTFLAKKLVKDFPNEFHKPLQITTRDKRDNEVEGKDYNFVSVMDYNEMLFGEELCCDTCIITDKANYYGTPKKNLSKDKINIIVVDKGGYQTRINSKREILIGLDYEIYTEEDKKRMEGREDRDQRENFEELKNEYFMDALLFNSSKNYINTKDLRKTIYSLFMKKGFYDVCMSNLEEKEDGN